MRPNQAALQRMREQFQFTHPGRGATVANLPSVLQGKRFNSRTPGGVRPRLHSRKMSRFYVSIHAPREGCDKTITHIIRHIIRFNSRTPGGVRHKRKHILICEVSFNSRTPGGVRLYGVNKPNTNLSFNSRTPGGVRLKKNLADADAVRVSIHAPREGCDPT